MPLNSSPFLLSTGAEISSTVALDGDRILFGSHDSFLYCLTPDGRRLWKFQTGSRIPSAPRIVGNFAITAGCDKRIHVIDIRNGEELRGIRLNTYLIASPAVLGNELYIGTYAGEVLAVNWKNAQIVWRYEDGRRALPFHASASVTDSHVLIGGRDKSFHCIDRATGRKVWRFPARARINSSSTVVGNRVFFGSDDGSIYGLRTSDGKQIWKYVAGKTITAGVAVGKGHLVVGEDATNGNLYCFGAK